MRTRVKVVKRPKCDFCKDRARYDAKTKGGPWAYMCQMHFERHGVGLGTGLGQRLECADDEIVYYHATWKDNLASIYLDGLKPGSDYLVYMCEGILDAARFLAIRQLAEGKEMVVLEIDGSKLDKNKIAEGMDHSPQFFGNVPVWTYPEKIPTTAIKQYFEIGRR